jgi:hypothetical protein
VLSNERTCPEPTTTTTTTEAPTTTTTSTSTSTTTTTTTAAPVSYSYLVHAQGGLDGFCDNPPSSTVYASASSLNIGVALYFDSELTIPANFPNNPVYIGLATAGSTVWRATSAVISSNEGTC